MIVAPPPTARAPRGAGLRFGVRHAPPQWPVAVRTVVCVVVPAAIDWLAGDLPAGLPASLGGFGGLFGGGRPYVSARGC